MCGHVFKPGAVPDDFGLFAAQDFEGLLLVGVCVGLDARGIEGGPCGVAAAGVADAGGEVAYDENGGVA